MHHQGDEKQTTVVATSCRVLHCGLNRVDYWFKCLNGTVVPAQECRKRGSCPERPECACVCACVLDGSKLEQVDSSSCRHQPYFDRWMMISHWTMFPCWLWESVKEERGRQLRRLTRRLLSTTKKRWVQIMSIIKRVNVLRKNQTWSINKPIMLLFPPWDTLNMSLVVVVNLHHWCFGIALLQVYTPGGDLNPAESPFILLSYVVSTHKDKRQILFTFT